MGSLYKKKINFSIYYFSSNPLLKRVFSLLVILFLLCASKLVNAQSGNCAAATPFFNVDLSNSPNGTWTSTPVARVGQCCNVTAPARCVEFKITLAPSAIAVNFQIVSGAMPAGAMFYQINCGPQVQVGTPVCLNGPGPYTLTFCKPGANINTYAVTSITPPSGPPDDTVGNGCNIPLLTKGLIPSSITWTSIFPGATGAYNSYLSCVSACSTSTVTGISGHPPYVDYQVCGTPAAGNCTVPGPFCDTFRIYMSSPLLTFVSPNPASFCVNNPTVLLTGSVSGGEPPYTYSWTNGPNGTGSIVGSGLTYNATSAGTYSFIAYDLNSPACPASITNVPVTTTPIPIVNAGADVTLCGPAANLNGLITGATGGIWSGGAGNFALGNSSLNNTYTFSPSEITNGIAVLTLTSTGNGNCNQVTDQIILNLTPSMNTTIVAPTIICFGQTATLSANVSGGVGPFTYSWNTGETTQLISGAMPGFHSVTVIGSGPGFCSTIDSIQLISNPQVFATTSVDTVIPCNSSTTVSVVGTGGVSPYHYSWSNGATNSSTTVNVGKYAAIVTDSVGCTASDSITISSNSSLMVSINQPSIICHGDSILLNATVSDATGGYTYLWNTGATTSSIKKGVGNYCVTVTDGAGCISTACVNVQEYTQILVSAPPPDTVCNGATGAITANASGGKSPYYYLWNTGQTTQSLIANAGTYTITVTDSAGCSVNTSATIKEASSIVIVPSFTGVSCFGGNNGTATAVVSGGKAPYSYAWLPFGGGSTTASALTAGTYTVVVTDAMGCSNDSSVTVTQPALLTATTNIVHPPSCNASSNGVASVIPTGGTPGYHYLWSPGGATTQTLSTLAAGTYSIAVNDTNGCSTTTQVVIIAPPVLTLGLVNQTNVTCFGFSNGIATVAAAGGTPNYSYVWTPSGGTHAIANNLVAGTYTATVTDTNGCIANKTVTITQPPVLVATITSQFNITCHGYHNGKATSVASGGTPPYLYSWNTSPVQTSTTALNLPGGTFAVTVTDSKNCVVTSADVIIVDPPLLVINSTPSFAITCTSSDTISGVATGGTGSYHYVWNTGATDTSIIVGVGSYVITVTDSLGCTKKDTTEVHASNSSLASSIIEPPTMCYGNRVLIKLDVTGSAGNNVYHWTTGATTDTITVGAGNYCASITDANSCTSTSCVDVNQNPPLSLNISVPPIICVGTLATFTANVGGGQTPYHYLWSDGQTTQSINKPAGSYSVTVYDSTGASCNISANASSVEEAPLTSVISEIDVSCFGVGDGSTSLYASGGKPPYTYLWSPTGGTNSSLNNLGPGTYKVTITDSLGCIKKDSTVVTQPATPVAITFSETDVLCYGDSTGIGVIHGTGGHPPYFYFWSLNGDTTASLGILPAGKFGATLADSTGCLASDSVTVNQPPQLVISTIASQIHCYADSGSVQLLFSGGKAPYTISGDDTMHLIAGTYTFTVTDSNSCSASATDTINPGPGPFILHAVPVQIACFGGEGSVILSVSGGVGPVIISGDSTTHLLAGTYNYSAMDSTGCITTAQAVIHPAPDSLLISTVVSQINCFGQKGSIQLLVSGGTPHYTISGADTVNLVAGTYTYTVIDTNGCSAFATDSVNPEPAPIVLSASANQFSCYGQKGSVSLSVVGGFGSIVYTGDDTTNLVAGTYNYVATDAHGCADTSQAVINAGPPPFTLTPIITQIACFGDKGHVHLEVLGGIGAVSISGSDTANLVPGSYSYLATDSNACTASATAIIDSVPPKLVASVLASQVDCFYSTNGIASALAVGGTPPYTYLWQNGATTDSITGLSISVDSVIITDNHGCLDSASAAVIGPSQLVINDTTIPSTCGINNGSATLTVTGGTAPYSYVWLPSVTTTNSFDSLFAGTYTVTVIDSKSCEQQDTITVDSSTYLHANFAFSGVCVNALTSFFDSSVVSPGSSITSWSWDFGDGSPLSTSANPTHTYSSLGMFNVSLTVHSSVGCVSSIVIGTHLYALPTSNFFSTNTCLGNATLFSDSSISAVGDTITNWAWDFGDTVGTSNLQNPNYTYINAGTFTPSLIVTTASGCKDTSQLQSTVYNNPIAQFTVTDSTGCLIHCPSFTDITDTLFGAITAWSWNFGDGTSLGANVNQEHCYTTIGNYSVSLTVTSNHGCTASLVKPNFITVYEKPTADFTYNPSSPTTLLDSYISFNNTSVGATSWYWNFGDLNDTASSILKNPFHNYSDTGTFCTTLIVSNANKCTDTVSSCLIIKPDYTFYIPNAFTPQNDGNNDVFRAYGSFINQFDLWIFDRWGNMIFHSSDLNVGWNGKANGGKELAQRDVYVYLVKLTDFRGGAHEYRGTVTLVR